MLTVWWWLQRQRASRSQGVYRALFQCQQPAAALETKVSKSRSRKSFCKHCSVVESHYLHIVSQNYHAAKFLSWLHQILTDCRNYFTVTLSLNIPPCEILMSVYEAKHLNGGDIYRPNNQFIANLLPSVPVETFWKLINIWRSYECIETGSLLFMDHPVYD